MAPPGHHTCRCWLLAGLIALALPALAQPRESVVTVLSDFESDTVAATIAAVRNVRATDCTLRMAQLPARGQQSIEVITGSTQAGAHVELDLTFRVPVIFDDPDVLAIFGRVENGAASVGLRIRDGSGRLFETALRPIGEPARWNRLEFPVKPENFRLLGANDLEASGPDARLRLPIEVAQVVVTTPTVGRQSIFLDDLEVEQRIAPQSALRGLFTFEDALHLFEPGATVRGTLELENSSRSRRLDVNAELIWQRLDGAQVGRQTAVVTLQPSGRDFRSRQPITFSQKLAQPGFYRLIARVQTPGWVTPQSFETTVAVLPSNRALPRGRSVFFGARSNLWREPATDQLLEIRLARELGVQRLAIDVPWRAIEPHSGAFDFAQLDRLVEAITARDIEPQVVITGWPENMDGGEALLERRAALLAALGRHYGARISYYQFEAPLSPSVPQRPELWADTLREQQSKLGNVASSAVLLSPPLPIGGLAKFEAQPGAAAPPPFLWAVRTDHRDQPQMLDRLLGKRDTAPGFPSDRVDWSTRGLPLESAGAVAHAERVLRSYITAARMGLNGCVWEELRDDASDARRLDQLTGLVQRDFSPKLPLMGLASTIGMLSGTRFVQAIESAPPDLDAYLFASSERQVVVLLPVPNKIGPALVTPVLDAPGTLRAADFERRDQVLIESERVPLAFVSPRPSFLQVQFEKMQAEPKLSIIPAWLRVPSTLLVGADATFDIEIDPPVNLQRSFLTLILPDDSPVRSTLETRVLSGPAGKTIRESAQLTADPERRFESATATLRVRIEGRTLEAPLDVRPLTAVPLATGGAALLATGDLASGAQALPLHARDAKAGDAPKLSVYCNAGPRELRFAFELPADLGDEDELQIGLVREGDPLATRWRVALGGKEPAVAPLAPFDAALAGRAAGRVQQSDAQNAPRRLLVTIPLPVTGSALATGQRFRLALRWMRAGAEVARFGNGLEIPGAADEYRWMIVR